MRYTAAAAAAGGYSVCQVLRIQYDALPQNIGAKVFNVHPNS